MPAPKKLKDRSANAVAPQATKKAKKSFQAAEKTRFAGSLKIYLPDLIIYLLATITWGIVLNYCYPVADMSSDTGGYIRWAQENKYGGTRPLGYSHFLNWIHSYSHSTTAVFITQLIIYFLATATFYLTVVYLFNIRKKVARAIFLMWLILCVTGFYATNLMYSDSLFLSLSLFMVTACLWFVYKPNVVSYLNIILFMMLAITVRYIGMIYPLIMVGAFIIGIRKKWLALPAVLIPCLLIAGYVNKVSDNTDRDQGVPVFSAFGGWQKANNALHIIPHIDLSQPLVTSDDPDVMMVDSVVRTTYPVFKSHYPGADEVSFSFIWNTDSLPLRPIMQLKRYRTGWSYYFTWNYMGPVYSKYGNALIANYPWEFARYYLYNNFKRMLQPEAEMFEKYLYTDVTGPFERKWFELNKYIKDGHDIRPAHDLLRPALKDQDALFPVFWLLFVSSMVGFLILHKKQENNPITDDRRPFRAMMLILAGYVLVYSFANLFAAPINLRFMIPTQIVIGAIVAICVNVLVAFYKRASPLNDQYKL